MFMYLWNGCLTYAHIHLCMCRLGLRSTKRWLIFTIRHFDFTKREGGKNRKRQWYWCGGFRMGGVFGIGYWVEGLGIGMGMGMGSSTERTAQSKQNPSKTGPRRKESCRKRSQRWGEGNQPTERRHKTSIQVSGQNKRMHDHSIHKILWRGRRSWCWSWRRVKANGDLGTFLSMAYDGFARLSMLMDFSTFSSRTDNPTFLETSKLLGYFGKCDKCKWIWWG